MANVDWGRKKAQESSSLSCLPCYATRSVISPLVWLPDPTGLEAQDGMAHPVGMTFTAQRDGLQEPLPRPQMGNTVAPVS